LFSVYTPAGGSGEKRPGEVAPVVQARPVCAINQVRLQGFPGSWCKGNAGATVSLAVHRQDSVTLVVAEIGHACLAELVHAERVVQQQPQGGCGAQPGPPNVGIGRGDQVAGLVAVQSDRLAVVGINPGSHHPGHRLVGDHVVGG
jgi:hypothetical protein